MARILSIKLILLFTINIVSAQFISDHIDRTVPNNIHGQLNYSDMPLFSPDRFSFNQGFSMSMMSSGSKPTSVASYSNNVTYWASNNLKINANILLYAPTGIDKINNNFSPQLAYDAGITYKPSKNSYIHLNFQKLPKLGIVNGLNNLAQENDMNFTSPPIELCTDNAAMIAWAGCLRINRGLLNTLDVSAKARWPLKEVKAK